MILRICDLPQQLMSWLGRKRGREFRKNNDAGGYWIFKHVESGLVADVLDVCPLGKVNSSTIWFQRATTKTLVLS